MGVHRTEGAPWNITGPVREIGYWIGMPYWGHGYVTEAARAVMAFAFEALDRPTLVSSRFADNPASGRVLEKLDLDDIGPTQLHSLSRGGAVDSCLLLLSRDTWAGKTGIN